jgi:DNA-directed RNA polymerase subunit RPC12/RpoP
LKCLRCWSFFEKLTTDVCSSCEQILIKKKQFA